MKYLILFILFSFTLPADKTSKQLFKDFHIYFEQRNFTKMDQLLADDFAGLNEKGEVSFKKTEYIAYMKDWNETFNTKWNVVKVTYSKEGASSIEYDTDIFNDYFYNGKMKIQYTYVFSKNQIKSITTVPLPGAAELENNFQNRFGKFTEWVKLNHRDKLKYCFERDKKSATETKALLTDYLAHLKNQGWGQ